MVVKVQVFKVMLTCNLHRMHPVAFILKSSICSTRENAGASWRSAGGNEK